jgi:serine/threonine protein kinase
LWRSRFSRRTSSTKKVSSNGFTRSARRRAASIIPTSLPVYDFDRVDDTVFIVMKVTSGSLRDLLTGPLPLDEVLELAAQWAGLATRTKWAWCIAMKPGNILIEDSRWALLTDFGLAKILAPGAAVDPIGYRRGHARLHVARTGAGSPGGWPRRSLLPGVML